MQQGEHDAQFLESMFRQYYYKCAPDIPVPSEITRREFGYQRFGGSGMIRHMQVKSAGEMRAMFVRNAPSDAYCSNAYYSYPDLEMSQKDWQGADLIFDIDAKDLDLPCRPSHAVEVCQDCGSAYAVQNLKRQEKAQPQPRGPDAASSGNSGDGNDSGNDSGNSDTKPADDGSTCTPDACARLRTRRKSLACKKCMDASKKQVARLLDILHDDLGVPHTSVTAYFSGNEGFHLHVSHAAFHQMNSRARADLVDYIALQGLIPETMGVTRKGPDKAAMPDLDARGWRGRFAKHAFGSKTRRNTIISDLSKKSPESAYAEFQSIIKDAASAIGVRIDPGVTMDIHRVFRMPHTLNSKSGMLKVACGGGVAGGGSSSSSSSSTNNNNDDLAAFDPYADAAVVLGDDPVRVTSDCPVRFSLRGKRFGPYRLDTVETVPGYAAAYMICKGIASVDTPPTSSQ